MGVGTSSRTITIDPMTRIEGHLRFETKVERGVVVDARVSGEMFRGIERALRGYDARAAQHITERVCGVCPYAHGEAASLALEDAMGLSPNENGYRLRNLIVGAYHLHDYLMHFYVLSALDFIDVAAVLKYRGRDETLSDLRAWVEAELASGKVFPAAPFFPRYEAAYVADRDTNLTVLKNYTEVFEILSVLQKMVALFGAKAPHPSTMEAGGVTTIPDLSNLARYAAMLERVEAFVRRAWRADVMAVARAFRSYFSEGLRDGGYLSYPFFPQSNGRDHAFAGGVSSDGRLEALDVDRIAEDHRYSFYTSARDDSLAPLSADELEPISHSDYLVEHSKADGKYSWIRAPRYGGQPVEVGPAARVINTYLASCNPSFNARVDAVNRSLGIDLSSYASVMGRHLARFVCGEALLELLKVNLDAVEPGKSAFVDRDVPKGARGVGLTEATRGALAHFVETDARGRIARYELIVPSTWNMSPRDAQGQPGPVESMLIGTKIADHTQPIELTRIVRAADPCLACSVH